MTTYAIPAIKVSFKRSQLYSADNQTALLHARKHAYPVSCDCEGGLGPHLTIHGASPRLFLKRGALEAAHHHDACAHGKPSANVVAERGYTPNAVERSADGLWSMNFGTLFIGGPAAETDDETVIRQGNGAPPDTPPLRNTVSLRGLMCWLLELGNLNLFDPSKLVSDPWSQLENAAASVKPAGQDVPRGISDLLLLPSRSSLARSATNASRLALAAEKRRAVLFAYTLPFIRPERVSALPMPSPFGVDFILDQGSLARALKRDCFAQKRASEGFPTLLFGRAHVRTKRPEGGPGEPMFEVVADRVELMPVNRSTNLFPLPSQRACIGLAKAIDSHSVFEARLPFDR